MGRPNGAVSILARLVGKERTTYLGWQEEDLVRGPRGANPTDLDALEVGALAFLLDELGDEDGRIAWKQVREAILAGIPSDEIRLVWHGEGWQAELCYDDKALVRSVASDSRPLRVLPLGRAANRRLAALRRRSGGLRMSGRGQRPMLANERDG